METPGLPSLSPGSDFKSVKTGIPFSSVKTGIRLSSMETLGLPSSSPGSEETTAPHQTRLRARQNVTRTDIMYLLKSITIGAQGKCTSQ
jgi:hypothetical protein